MIKLVYCFKKKPGMSFADFSEYWKEVHGPIGARIPGLLKLVQSVAAERTEDRRRPDFDGMAELWFDDWESLLQARQSPEWQASGLDEATFIDLTSTAYFVSEERTIVDNVRP